MRRRFKHTTMSDHDQPVAANLLDRQFTADAPNRRWVGDTTEFVIGTSSKLYLAVVLDLFSRFVVGWAVSAVNDRHLTMKALEIAVKRRCPDADGSIGLVHIQLMLPDASSENVRNAPTASIPVHVVLPSVGLPETPKTVTVTVHAYVADVMSRMRSA